MVEEGRKKESSFPTLVSNTEAAVVCLTVMAHVVRA